MNMTYEKIDCPHCGASNKSTLKYCMSCGFALPPKPVINQVSDKEKQPAKRNNIRAAIIGVALTVVLSFGLPILYKLLLQKPAYDAVLTRVASEFNKNCPIMVDRETRLDNALSIGNNLLQYNYTLMNLSKSDLDTAVLKQKVEPSIIEDIKTNPQMKLFRDMKTTLNYAYRDKNGAFVFLISITPDQYQ
jgi:hypothetical protein